MDAKNKTHNTKCLSRYFGVIIGFLFSVVVFFNSSTSGFIFWIIIFTVGAGLVGRELAKKYSKKWVLIGSLGACILIYLAMLPAIMISEVSSCDQLNRPPVKNLFTGECKTFYCNSRTPWYYTETCKDIESDSIKDWL